MKNIEEAPSEDLIARITEAATAASLKAVNEMLAPLIEKAEALQQRERSGCNVLPARKGLITVGPIENQPEQDSMYGLSVTEMFLSYFEGKR